MNLNHRPAILTLLLLVLAIPLTGCATRETGESPPVEPIPETFSDSGTQSVPDRWWTAFGDTELNQLVNRALDENFDLKTAWNRLSAARAVVRRESASFYPDLEATASGEITRGERNGTTSPDDEELRLGLTSEYEVDLWGRIQSSVEAERYRARATLSDYRTAAISLSSEVTRTWYQLVEQHNQLNLINQQIETNRKVLKLLKSRFDRGQIRSADILRQRQLLESTREQRIQAESSMRVLEHRLAVLLGRTPQEGIGYEPDTMPVLPPLPHTGLPVDLLRRRPDVRGAYNRLKAADEELAAAISDQYPRLTLTASLSSSDDDARELFDDWARSFAGDLTAPLLDAGRRKAEADRARAVKKQRLYEYGQTILTSFQEVEDALIQEKKQLQRIRSLEQQIELAQRTIDRLRTQYLNGTGDFLDVLQALSEEQQLRRDLLSARLVHLERRIALYRALAGGFTGGGEHRTET